MMNRLLKQIRGYSKGQLMILYAIGMTALIGVLALCTDVAVAYVNYIQVQKGVDESAIAGATYLTGLTFSSASSGCTSQPDDASKAACTYAAKNGLATDANSLTITEPSSTTIEVAANRSNLPYFFGKVVGANTYNVSASATAQALLAAGTVKNGMFPVGLQCTSPCNLKSMDPGQSVSFGQKFVGGLAPGNWQFLALGGTGNSTLGTNLDQGATGTYTLNQTINSEPGNGGNSSNARTGLSDRLAKCESIADPCTSAGGNPHDIPTDDPCLVIVPAVDYHGCTGSCTMTIEGFALIYLEPATTTSTDIEGCFVQAVAPDTINNPSAPTLGADMPPKLID